EVREKKNELVNNMDYVRQLRLNGAQKANNVAEEILSKVKKSVGFEVHYPENLEKPKINFDHFSKVDLRIGEIISAEKVEWADKLLKLEIDFGTEKRQILAGIAEYKKPEEIIGKQIPVIFNL